MTRPIPPAEPRCLIHQSNLCGPGCTSTTVFPPAEPEPCDMCSECQRGQTCTAPSVIPPGGASDG